MAERISERAGRKKEKLKRFLILVKTCDKRVILVEFLKGFFVSIYCRSCFILLTILLTVYKSGAQLCQGSLGDPIVNITFGSGNNPGSALAYAP